jgi:tRNA(Ile)-lysidine synthase TilS/MesJ
MINFSILILIAGQSKAKEKPLMKAFKIFVLIGFFLFSVSASAEFYKYLDENGNVRFTDDINQVPEEQRAKIRSYVESESEDSAPQQEVTQESQEEQEQPETAAESIIDDTGEASLEAAKKQIDELKQKLDEEYKALVEEGKQLAKAREAAVTNEQKIEFNKKVDDYNKRGESYQATQKEYEAQVEAYNGRVNEHNAAKKSP